MFCGKISLCRWEGEKRDQQVAGLDITLPDICMDLKTTLSVKADGSQGASRRCGGQVVCIITPKRSPKGTKQGQLKHILLKQHNTVVARAEGNALFGLEYFFH
ncbi:unnamed protein product [Lepidochelys olivacea]